MVLNGGGLTNRPFVKEMQALFSEQQNGSVDNLTEKTEHKKRIKSDKTEKKEKIMTFDEIIKELAAINLSDEQKDKVCTIAQIKRDDIKLSGENATLLGKLEERDAKIVTLSDELAKVKKESEFAIMLSEGHAVEAQRDAYMSGDVKTFAEKAVKVNLKADGTGTGDIQEDVKTFADAEEKTLSLTNEKMKADKSLTFADAMKEVFAENPILKKFASE